MNKKNVLQLVKVLILGLVLSIGVSYVFSAPIGGYTPPSLNVPGPINVGSAIQEKLGSLKITAGGFRVFGPSIFDDRVSIGTLDSSSRLNVGGIGDSETAISGIASGSFLNGIYGAGETGVYGGGTSFGVIGSGPVGISGVSDAGVGVEGNGMTYDFYARTAAGKSYFAGNVGIGVLSPMNKLDVKGAVKFGDQTTGTLCNANAHGSQRYNTVSGVMEFCTNTNTWIPISAFGGTYTVYAQTSPLHTAGDCFTGNPLNSNTCACPSGFSSYTMAEYTFISSPGNYMPYLLKGCHN